MSADEELDGSPSTGAPEGDRPGFDTSVAHSARVHDYWLGRKIEVFYPGEQ
jgi:hypothetical protein